MPSFSCSSPPSVPVPRAPRGRHHQCHANLAAVRTLVESTTGTKQTAARPSQPSFSPFQSLHRGDWVKLICGASFEDVADVRNLSLVYALAGGCVPLGLTVDCIDCAADSSVVNAVMEGVEVALSIAPVRRPWVMISVNDDEEDLHFRKAEFDPEECPPDCSRPCERVCPANAISLENVAVEEGISDGIVGRSRLQGGVITERCYGCGRCFPVCPYDKIRSRTYIRDTAATSELLLRDDVDAIEIHTSGKHLEQFEKLWVSLGDSIHHVKLVAVSLPRASESIESIMDNLYLIMGTSLQCHNLWQLDGRPMSGDIGRGATRDAISFAIHLAASGNKPPGFLQLAGGTNSHTVDYLKKIGLFQTWALHDRTERKDAYTTSEKSFPALIGGVAYGGYARKVVGRVLSQLSTQHGRIQIEDYPQHLLEALRAALSLVGPMKRYRTIE